jgi:hypothetical protein
MAGETKVDDRNGSPAEDGAPPGGAARLTRDIVELGELQMRLLMLDAQASSAHARGAIVWGMLAGTLLLSTLEIALLWIAAALVYWAGWPWVAGLGISIGAGVLLAIIPVIVALVHLRRATSTWRRSRRELDKNMAWVKATLGTQTGPVHQPPRDRSRSE